MSLAWRVRSASGMEPIPPGWSVRRVGDLVTLTNGYPFPSESFGPTGDVPLIRIRDLGDAPFKTFVSGYIPPSALLRNGDVVIGMDGDFNLTVWKRGVAALNQRLCLLRPKSGIDMRFVAYALPASLKIINDLTFSTTVKHLSSADVLSEQLVLPPLEEQRRIADFLDAETGKIDTLTSRRIRQKAALSERASAMVSETLIPGILEAPLGVAPYPWLPSLDGVPLVRMGYVSRLRPGISPSALPRGRNDDVLRPFLQISNVQAGRLRLDSVSDVIVSRPIVERTKLRTGDVLTTRVGDPDKLGRAAVWSNEITDCLFESNVFAIRPERERLDPRYLAALTQTLHGRCYFESTGFKTTGLASTNTGKVLGFPIPLPALRRQRDLVQQVEEVESNLDSLSLMIDRQISLLAKRRQALVTAAVTGQFDVSTASGREGTEGVSL